MAFVELAELKDDLGIVGTADDAWLQRRVDEILAAMNNYTHGYIGPIATFEDDFTRIVDRGRLWISPPYPAQMRVASYLSQKPVTEIVSASNNGTSVNIAKILFDPKSGEIHALDGAPALDVSRSLIGAWIIRFKAGWAAIPRDLYAVVAGSIRDQYQIRKAQAAGLSIGGLGIKAIAVPDVGNVTLGDGASQFQSAALKGRADPLLGPWLVTLDPYFRPVIGDMGAPASRLVSTP